MNSNTLKEIRAYLQSIKPLFIEGNTKLVSEWWRVKITYKDCFLDFTIKEKLPKADKECIHKVIDFCFDCYFDYEWKWWPMNSELLGRLLNIKPASLRSVLSHIYNKIEVYGEPILSEKQASSNIQNNQQRTARSIIQEKSCSSNIGEKEERT